MFDVPPLESKPAEEQPPDDTYTVIGFWYNDWPVVTGVIQGEHNVCGGTVDDLEDTSFQGEWAISVTAPDADHAQDLAIDEMHKTLDTDDDEDDDEDDGEAPDPRDVRKLSTPATEGGHLVFEGVSLMAMTTLLFTEFDLAFESRDQAKRSISRMGYWRNKTGDVRRLPDGTYTVRVFGRGTPDDTV